MYRQARYSCLAEGLYHWGADAVILEAPTEVVRRCLTRDLLPGGVVVEVDRKGKAFRVEAAGQEPAVHRYTRSMEDALVKLLEPVLKARIHEYNVVNAIRA